MPTDLLFQLVSGALIATGVNIAITFLFERLKGRTRPPEQALQGKLAAALSALKRHSEQATSLLEALQSEVGKRTDSVRTLEAELDALRQQRKLLDLTPEQREAITNLVR